MADIQVQNHGSIVMVAPVTEAGREWVDEHVQLESWQWMGGAFAVEPRMVDDLVEGMRDAGLEVE